MPTYEYKCNACGHRFEQFQSMSDKSLRKCPKCAKSALERLIGVGAGVIFKGSGFYETDYRSDSYKKAADADKKGSGSSGGSESGGEHVHTGSCACGKKPAGECASSSPGGGGGGGAEKSATSESKPSKASAKKAKPKPA